MLLLAGCGKVADTHQESFKKSDTLWHIVHDQCVPNQEQNGQPKPCAEVNLDQGWVVLKDLKGPLHFLLMPVNKVSGTEDPQILAADSVNFFERSWQARHFMANKLKKPIDDSNVMLAVNSQHGRSQNHIHIHISCIRPDIKRKFADYRGGQQWQRVTEPLVRGHYYSVREITPQQLQNDNVFRLLTELDPDARQHMGEYSLAMMKLNNGDFLLLATRLDRLSMNFASAEELQDHDCTVLELGQKR